MKSAARHAPEALAARRTWIACLSGALRFSMTSRRHALRAWTLPIEAR